MVGNQSAKESRAVGMLDEEYQGFSWASEASQLGFTNRKNFIIWHAF